MRNFAHALLPKQTAEIVRPRLNLQKMIYPPQAVAMAVSRGSDEMSESPFSYADLKARIPARHPLRKIRQVVNEALDDNLQISTRLVVVAEWRQGDFRFAGLVIPLNN